MSVVFIKKVSENAQLGLWKIDEPVEILLNNLNLSSEDQRLLVTKNNIARKKEWLAARNLLNAMLPENMGVGYTEFGKPVLNASDKHISISHSGEYVCVYLNDQNPVGVDIQKLKPDISKGADFFLSAEELHHFDTSDNVLLHILWTVKEAVFKFIGNPDTDIKKDIYLLPFHRNQSGTVEVNIVRDSLKEKLFLEYQFFDNYILTRTN